MSLLAVFVFAAGLGLCSTFPNPALPLQYLTQPSFPFNSSNQTSSFTLSLNASKTTLLATTKPRCVGGRFGYELNLQSCIEAWRSISADDQTRFTFGARTMGHFEVPLPYRVLSPDGLCAIDIKEHQGAKWDSATWAEISVKASEVVDYCVRLHSQKLGGSIGGVGAKGALSVAVKSYKPDVTCRSYPPYVDRGRCSIVLGMLPIARVPFVFTRTGSTGPRRVKIPDGKNFTEPEGVCTAVVDLEDDKDDTGSWLDLWAGAVAVNAMCVKDGKAGMSFGHGEHGRLTIEFGP